MTLLAVGEYKPDVADYNGSHTKSILNVIPRGDGYGPVKALAQFSQALGATCRGAYYARKTDGTITILAGTSNRLFKMDNTTLGWTPVSKVTALTSISNASPAVFTLAAHGLADGDTLVLSTTGTLPTGLTAGTVYYVVSSATNTFSVSTSSGGAAVNTTGAGSGTHSMTYFYTTLPTNDNWEFTQFGSNVVAVQANENLQVIDISTTSAFSDLSGTPPPARYVTVVGRFLVLSGLTSNPTRVHWSGLDDITQWTAGTNFSNYVDLPDGGVVRGVGGGEFGLILQESATRRMIYVPGATPAFQIERIGEDIGLFGPYSLIRAGSRLFFYSAKGFQAFLNGEMTPIGKERVDRTFADDLDTGSLQLFIGAHDPTGTRVVWAYKSINGTTGLFDKLIIYDYVIDRWSMASCSGEYICAITKPGLTLDALTSISASLDALTFSLDEVSSAVLSVLAAFDSSHQLSLFNGDNLEATLETPEQNLGGLQRVFVSGIQPITDAATVYGSLKTRSTQSATPSAGSETLMDSNGVSSQRKDARYVRAKLRIPAAETWTFCAGVEPIFRPTGQR